MTVDINFGKLATETEDGETWQYAEWPGDPREDDGTNPEFSIYSGRPRRSFSYSGFADWTRRIPEAKVIADVCWIEERQGTPLDATLLRLINRLPDTGARGDIDRARWFKYWARRAVETFGSDAIVYFS